MNRGRVHPRVRQIVVIILVLLPLTGCGRIFPVTSGFHASDETFMLGNDVNGRFMPSKPETVVIWANDIGVEHHLAGILLQTGYRVVERGRLQQIFNEQKIRLMNTPDSEADVLQVGRLAGATQVVFVDVQREPQYGREIKSASIAIRGVSVETAQVRWSGTARVKASGMFVLEDAQEGGLAELALRRATCPIETGRFEWIEKSDWDHAGGCRQRRP
ncbi:MAG TPA: hypothetical protein VJT11_04125 [Nitrospiraceae bacterium]|nr:hypothetical protein [Nitrospiraceae bacterium]